MRIVHGLACTDCIMVIANADTSGILDLEAWEQRVTAHNATDSGAWHIVPDLEDTDESHFCSSPCDYCGGHLAGDRYRIAFLGN